MDPLVEFQKRVKMLERAIQRISTRDLNIQSLKDEIRSSVQYYFSDFRAAYLHNDGSEPDLAETDSLMQGHFESMKKIIKALAIVHTELVLIHPFREGNGRVARMLATLMALQAGLPPLDFSGIVGNRKKDYIQAIHAGIEYNYLPMERIFNAVIRRTLRIRGHRQL
ncbi:MAG: hypothetical protein FJY07_12195 [Bacteroidetes bacterium]|nr:hypothetical protein [Bacteroidota bacterium]